MILTALNQVVLLNCYNVKMKIASVESLTGGLFASAIVKNKGASKYFKGSIVTYTNDIKEKFGIDTSKGVVNKETAIQMALKGKAYFDVDFCVSFTGNAGPSTLENQPVGKVFIAINEKVYELDFKGSRISIQKQCVAFALKKIQKFLTF